VIGSRACSPVQKTTLRFVGSTTGRQIAGRAILLATPVAGSSTNEATDTAGEAEAVADDVGPELSTGVSPGVVSGDGRGGMADFECPVGSGWSRDAEGPGRLDSADAAAGTADGDGELACDGSADGEPGIGDSGAGDSGAAIVTAGASDVGLPAGSTELPRIWSRFQAEKTDAWSVVSWRAFGSPTRQT
jgi:hypothetical protein